MCKHKHWRKLFVHGLDFKTSKEQLKAWYENFGKVEEAVILIDNKGASKGFGFVTFFSPNDALSAVMATDKKIGNHVTRCNYAWRGNPRKEKSNNSNGNNGNNNSNTNGDMMDGELNSQMDNDLQDRGNSKKQGKKQHKKQQN